MDKQTELQTIEDIRDTVKKLQRYINAYNKDMILKNLKGIENKLNNILK